MCRHCCWVTAPLNSAQTQSCTWLLHQSKRTEYYNNPRERDGGGGGIKRGGNSNREVGSGPHVAAWIIKEGFVLRTKKERWRTRERRCLNNIQHSAGWASLEQHAWRRAGSRLPNEIANLRAAPRTNKKARKSVSPPAPRLDLPLSVPKDFKSNII